MGGVTRRMAFFVGLLFFYSKLSGIEISFSAEVLG